MRSLAHDVAWVGRTASPLLSRCESVLEVAFAGALLGLKGVDVVQAGERWAVTKDALTLTLVAQHEVMLGQDPWFGDPGDATPFARADFAFLAEGKPVLLVDVDGHEFHERRRQDIVRDRKRDRRILRCGLRLVRFTSTELMDNAQGCALEALAVANLFAQGEKP